MHEEKSEAMNEVAMDRVVLKPLRCPKCRSVNVQIVEVWHFSTITWDPGDAHDEGNLEAGFPTRVEGLCLCCEHRWKMRGLIRVTEELHKRSAESRRILSS